jgi:hypothetical protein
MNKKGALELSINAIVILIIAITMLGLALGFTRGMFGKASGQFDEMISTEAEPPTPSSSEPLTFSKEKIITEASKPVILKIGVYNPTGEDLSASQSGGTRPTLSCLPPFHAGAPPEDPNPPTSFGVNPKAIKKQESATYIMKFVTPTVTGSGICRVSMVGYKAGSTVDLLTSSKDFILTVK